MQDNLFGVIEPKPREIRRMKLISLQLPESYVRGLERLVEEGLYPNKSAAIRFAIKDLLKDELWER